MCAWRLHGGEGKGRGRKGRREALRLAFDLQGKKREVKTGKYFKRLLQHDEIGFTDQDSIHIGQVSRKGSERIEKGCVEG